jgi:hypothetical protein
MPNNQSKSSIAAKIGGTPAAGSSSEIDAILAEIRTRTTTESSVRGRLIFALDATASRQSVWDTACQLQGEMFRTVASVGSLDMQLVYYRGLGECRASRWISQPEQLARTMSQIMCHAGETQIGKILTHAQKETKLLRVTALVFVGENPDTLVREAGELGKLGVPAFMFQEGRDRQADHVFRTIATTTRGAYCRFDPGAADQLGQLLRAVAVYAAGGLKALANFSAGGREGGAVKLLSQLKGP